MVMSRR